jgi:hypothetical protein
MLYWAIPLLNKILEVDGTLSLPFKASHKTNPLATF